MIHFSVIFLCNSLLQLLLLEDKYQIFATSITSLGVYILSIISSLAISRLGYPHVEFEMLCILINGILLFISSLHLFKNSIAQKLFLCILCFSNYYFANFFAEALLSILPIEAAGAFAAVFTDLVIVLFYFLIGLCLYRFFHYFSDRASSGFMAVMIIVQLLPCLLVNGVFDFIFYPYILGGKLFFSLLVYAFVIFSSRSLYQAAKFREEATLDYAKKELIQNQAERFVETFALTNEHQRICREQEYILDAVTLMVRDNVPEQIPIFISSQRQSQAESILLKTFHKNPYLNAVLISHAASAKENHINFECNVQTGDKRFPISELCILTNELLTKACQEARNCTVNPRVRYSISPTDETLRVEVVFSADIYSTESSKRSDESHLTFSKIFNRLFKETANKINSSGLEHAKELVAKYSGTMDISNTEDSIMIHISLHH